MPRNRHEVRVAPVLVAMTIALLVHIPLAIWFVQNTWLRESSPHERTPIQVTLNVQPPEAEEEEPEAEDEADDEGQIVEIAPPEEPERPEEADFLSEYDSTVPEETVDPRYRHDREVTAETYSPDDAFELEESQGVEVDAPSTGATAGREIFRHGDFSLYPDRHSRWDLTNSRGLDAPAPISHETTRLAGSPSNDWLPEIDAADRTALNTKETLYASYWNRIKQLVSFYAHQTLANARSSVPLRSPKYEMVLTGLIAPDGHLEAIEVARSCGIPEFDTALVEAFDLAGPFPEPPDGLVESDGYVHMDGFGFVITIGGARAELSGIDPRQNVQFPGLQTVPR